VKRTLILAAAAVLGVQADAREVAIENFNQPERIDGDVFDTRSAELAFEPDPAVASAMFMHFAKASQPASAPSVGTTTAGLLGPQFPPEWGNSGLVTAKPENLSERQFANCDSTTYTPTWWLSRDAETRRARYFTTMASIACEHGLSTNLLDAVISQESGYRSWAMSSAGAMGMMQIMPGTARVLGLALPFDPISNMRAGARYLRQQIDRFGRIDLALAAYNAGPERKSLRVGAIPAISETRQYVRTITTNWARLAARTPELITASQRSAAAILAVRAFPYRSVELISYQGSNASNPM
jgi:soluble lytic murein transglycosylase-like protein